MIDPKAALFFLLDRHPTRSHRILAPSLCFRELLETVYRSLDIVLGGLGPSTAIGYLFPFRLPARTRLVVETWPIVFPSTLWVTIFRQDQERE